MADLTEAQRGVLKLQRLRRSHRRALHAVGEFQHDTRVMMVNFRRFLKVLKQVQEKS